MSCYTFVSCNVFNCWTNIPLFQPIKCFSWLCSFFSRGAFSCLTFLSLQFVPSLCPSFLMSVPFCLLQFSFLHFSSTLLSLSSRISKRSYNNISSVNVSPTHTSSSLFLCILKLVFLPMSCTYILLHVM